MVYNRTEQQDKPAKVTWKYLTYDLSDLRTYLGRHILTYQKNVKKIIIILHTPHMLAVSCILAHFIIQHK